MKRIAAIAGLALCAGAAQAQQLSYVGQGTAAPDSTYGALELWGRPGQPGAQASIGAGTVNAPEFLQTLLSRASAALAPYAQVETRFGYDAAAIPLGSSPGDGPVPAAAWYAADDLKASLRASDGTVVNLSSAAQALVVAHADWGGLEIGPLPPRPSAPLPGVSFGFQDATPLSGTLDLAPWLQSAFASGFELGGITRLPVRYTSAQSHALVNMTVFAYDFNNPAQPHGLGLPNPLQPADYNNGLRFGIEFEGVFAFTVDPADYATTADFEEARAWVDDNVARLDFHVSAAYRIDELTVTSVPEPAPAALLSAGVLMLAWRARRRA